MEAVLRENKGLTPQAGGLPFSKLLFNIRSLETLSGTNWFPLSIQLTTHSITIKGNFAEKKEVNSTQVIKKKTTNFY